VIEEEKLLHLILSVFIARWLPIKWMSEVMWHSVWTASKLVNISVEQLNRNFFRILH